MPPKAAEDSALVARQKLWIAKLEHQIYGQRSERSARLVDQLALAFEELEASAGVVYGQSEGSIPALKFDRG